MSTKTIRIPTNLTRAAEIKQTGDGEERTFTMSISSDTPYLRYDWYNDEEYFEVLDHTPGGIDEERLRQGLPILFNHDRDLNLARATKFENDGHKITVSGFIWSDSEFAKQKKSDAVRGVLPDTSVGYEITDEGECIGAKDGKPIYRFKWKCFEGSIVTIPADASVGVARQREAAKDDAQFREIQVREKKSVDGNGNVVKKATTQKAMLTKPGQKFHEEADDNKGGVSVEVVAEREKAAGKAALDAERDRVKKINEYAKSFNRNADMKKPIEELVREAIDAGLQFPDFQQSVFDNWKSATRVEGADADPNIGMSQGEIKEFSFCKFYLEASSPKGLTGFEKEVCDTAAAKYRRDNNRPFSGHCVPQDILTADFAAINGMGRADVANLYQRITQAERMLGRSQNATSFTAGGFTVGVNLLAGSYIDLLRNATLIGNGPFSIIEINGATGNIAIPKQTSTITTYWLAEGATVSESNFAGGQLLFSPKRLVSRNSYTKQLLAQGTPSIEMLVRNDMALAQGVEEDRAIIQGTGLAGEPLGIINTSGVGANVTFSGNWTWAKTLLFESSLENANVRTGEMVFLTNPTTKGRAKATPVVASSTFPIFIWMGSKGEFPTINGVKGGIVNEYGAYATKNATANVLFGVFNNNVTKVRWAGMDIVVDPYTGSASELVYVTQTQWLDVGIRYPQAFEYSVDAPTAP